jgi:hypothetical protein
MMHGFFAVMGGFVINLKGEDKYTRLFRHGFTITPRGILVLAELDLIPDIPLKRITVRSRADQLAKALVCFQAAWMVVQTIARRFAGLPITLLELNTLAHVMCAVILYVAWWDKPQNVNEPLEIHLEPSVAAIIFYLSSYDFECIKEDENERSENVSDNSSNIEDPNYEISVEYNRRPEPVERIQRNDVDVGWQSWLPLNKSNIRVVGKIKKEWDPSNEKCRRLVAKEAGICRSGVVMLLPGQFLEGIPFSPRSEPRYLEKDDVEALQLMAKARDHPEHSKRLTQYADAKASVCLAKKASNLEIEGNLEELREYETFLLWILLCMLYGGVHATSWHDHFPSFVEQTMWRVATCVIAGGAIVISILRYLYRGPLAGGRSLHCNQDRQGSHFCCSFNTLVYIFQLLAKTCAMVAARIIFAAFMLSRVYLVIEAFISVRSLPLGAYTTVRWVAFLPHIGSS